MTSIYGYAAGAGAAGDFGTYGLLVQQSGQIKSRLDTLTEQASSGLVSAVFSGLGGSAEASLDLRGEISAQTAQLGAISAADSAMQLTQATMTQISSIASSFYQSTTSLGLNAGNTIDVLAASARDSLKELAGLLNTQNANSYIFAGSDTGEPPIPDAATLLSGGFYTAINAAVQGLGSTGAAGVAAATLATAASNVTGTSPFSASLSQAPALVNATLPTVEIGSGQRLAIGVAAGSNATAASYGTSTTGSYIRDLMRSLATIGSLNSGLSTAAGFNDLVADTHASLGGALNAISDEQGMLGNTQARIDGAGTLLTASNTALASQVSNIQDVDIASVATQLTQTQANLQASYKLIAGMSDNSLLKYL